MTPTRTTRRPPLAARAALAVVGLALALAGCTTQTSTLLDPSDFDDVAEATHDTDGYHAPGWTWCSPLSPVEYYRRAPTSMLVLGDGSRVGATIIDRSADGIGADAMLSTLEDKAALCADGFGARQGDTIEPLAGLAADTVGWRTETADGERGEFAVIRLDDTRLLAVGFATDRAEAPVALDELIRLARDGSPLPGPAGPPTRDRTADAHTGTGRRHAEA